MTAQINRPMKWLFTYKADILKINFYFCYFHVEYSEIMHDFIGQKVPD